MNKQNIKKEQTETAKKRHEDSIKYMYFSRYLLIRYIITIFFFTNLMWLIIDVNYHSVLGIIVSAIMTIYSGIASIEQLTKMHNRKREVPISKVYLEVQAALNLLFIILTFLPLGKYLYPIHRKSKYYVLYDNFVFSWHFIVCLERIPNSSNYE